MYELRLCETRVYEPRIIEHWLYTIQKQKENFEILLAEKEGKIHIYCSEDLSTFLLGGSCISSNQTTQKANYFISQNKGPLLPIKRHAQFEDRTNKERIFPMDTLIPLMAKLPNSFLRIKFTPIKERKRRKALAKAKQSFFVAERRFDQWESKAWFNFKLRRILGPSIRLSLTTKEQKLDEQTESLHEREDPTRAILDKLSRPLFNVEISSSHKFEAFINGFSIPYLGQLKILRKKSKCIFSAEELAGFICPPDPQKTAALLNTESTAYLPAPIKPLELTEEDRKRHLYILGKTGMGKSTILLKLFQQDLKRDCCIIMIDPHGDLITNAMALIPETRQKDLVLINPGLIEFPLALNPLESLGNPTLQTSAILEIFRVLAKGSWGPRLEYILRNSLLTLILCPNTTLLDLPRLLTNPKRFLNKIHDLELIRFWTDEFLTLEPKTRKEHIAPILNKVGPLLLNPMLRNIFGQPKTKLNFKKLLNKNKIILINLSKGQLGEDVSNMLGMIFISIIQSTLLSRSNEDISNRNLVTLTIDEFQNFSTNTFLSMLAESRKYGLALTIANQYLSQLEIEIQDAVLGNTGSLLCFRTSFQDAQKLSPQLNLTENDLTGLTPFQAYASLLKNQKPLPIFRLNLNKPEAQKEISVQTIKHLSKLHGRSRSLVEEKLHKRYSNRI